MERVLVAYGDAAEIAEIAETVGEVLRARGMAADVRPAASVDDVLEFDAVVLGGAVERGKWPKDCVRFAKRFAGELVMAPVWLFSSGPLDDSADRHAIPPVPSALKAMERLDARAHMTFGGFAPESTRPHGVLRRRRTVPAADFRNFERIACWADDIAIELGTPALHLLAV